MDTVSVVHCRGISQRTRREILEPHAGNERRRGQGHFDRDGQALNGGFGAKSRGFGSLLDIIGTAETKRAAGGPGQVPAAHRGTHVLWIGRGGAASGNAVCAFLWT
jgi:hypothetical protein